MPLIPFSRLFRNFKTGDRGGRASGSDPHEPLLRRHRGLRADRQGPLHRPPPLPLLGTAIARALPVPHGRGAGRAQAAAQGAAASVQCQRRGAHHRRGHGTSIEKIKKI